MTDYKRVILDIEEHHFVQKLPEEMQKDIHSFKAFVYFKEILIYYCKTCDLIVGCSSSVYNNGSGCPCIRNDENIVLEKVKQWLHNWEYPVKGEIA